MVNNTEDTNRNIRTILFLVLFSLLLFSSSDIQGNNDSSSTRNYSGTELFSVAFSDHHYTVLCRAFSLPDLYKFYECALRNTNLIPFSIRYKISDYNRRIAQNFIMTHNKSLSIEPIPPLRFHFHLSLENDDDLPVLS